MKFYSRNDILYVRLNGKRVSTKLKDTQKNRKLVMSYYKNDEFFKKFDVNKNVPTVVELCEEVLREKENILKPTSYYVYESLYRTKIISFFKNKLISEVEPLDIESWYKNFNDRSTLTVCTTIFKDAIEKAIIRRYIKQTPLIVRKPSFKSNYEMNPLTISEIYLLINNAKKWFKNFIGISFFTGIRTGELIGLKWKDIDFNNYTISISRTKTNGYEQSPKTKSSIRVIDMLPQCEEYFNFQRKYTGLSEYIFLNDDNKTFNDSSSLRYMWNKLLVNSNLKHRGIYQLRHSFASNMLSNGEDLLWVSSMLGHKSANITLEKYTKYLRRKQERKTTFLDDDTSLAQ